GDIEALASQYYNYLSGMYGGNFWNILGANAGGWLDFNFGQGATYNSPGGRVNSVNELAYYGSNNGQRITEEGYKDFLVSQTREKLLQTIGWFEKFREFYDSRVNITYDTNPEDYYSQTLDYADAWKYYINRINSDLEAGDYLAVPSITKEYPSVYSVDLGKLTAPAYFDLKTLVIPQGFTGTIVETPAAIADAIPPQTLFNLLGVQEAQTLWQTIGQFSKETVPGISDTKYKGWEYSDSFIYKGEYYEPLRYNAPREADPIALFDRYKGMAGIGDYMKTLWDDLLAGKSGFSLYETGQAGDYGYGAAGGTSEEDLFGASQRESRSIDQSISYTRGQTVEERTLSEAVSDANRAKFSQTHTDTAKMEEGLLFASVTLRAKVKEFLKGHLNAAAKSSPLIFYKELVHAIAQGATYFSSGNTGVRLGGEADAGGYAVSVLYSLALRGILTKENLALLEQGKYPWQQDIYRSFLSWSAWSPLTTSTNLDKSPYARSAAKEYSLHSLYAAQVTLLMGGGYDLKSYQGKMDFARDFALKFKDQNSALVNLLRDPTLVFTLKWWHETRLEFITGPALQFAMRYFEGNTGYNATSDRAYQDIINMLRAVGYYEIHDIQGGWREYGDPVHFVVRQPVYEKTSWQAGLKDNIIAMQRNMPVWLKVLLPAVNIPYGLVAGAESVAALFGAKIEDISWYGQHVATPMSNFFAEIQQGLGIMANDGSISGWDRFWANSALGLKDAAAWVINTITTPVSVLAGTALGAKAGAAVGTAVGVPWLGGVLGAIGGAFGVLLGTMLKTFGLQLEYSSPDSFFATDFMNATSKVIETIGILVAGIAGIGGTGAVSKAFQAVINKGFSSAVGEALVGIKNSYGAWVAAGKLAVATPLRLTAYLATTIGKTALTNAVKIGIIGGGFYTMGAIAAPFIQQMPAGTSKELYQWILQGQGAEGFTWAGLGAAMLQGAGYGLTMTALTPIARLVAALPGVGAISSFFSAAGEATAARFGSVGLGGIFKPVEMFMDEGVKENLVQTGVTSLLTSKLGYGRAVAVGNYVAEMFDETPDGINTNVKTKTQEIAGSTMKAFIINLSPENILKLADVLMISNLTLTDGIPGGISTPQGKAAFADLAISRIATANDSVADAVESFMVDNKWRVDLVPSMNPVNILRGVTPVSASTVGAVQSVGQSGLIMGLASQMNPLVTAILAAGGGSVTIGREQLASVALQIQQMSDPKAGSAANLLARLGGIVATSTDVASWQVASGAAANSAAARGIANLNAMLGIATPGKEAGMLEVLIFNNGALQNFVAGADLAALKAVLTILKDNGAEIGIDIQNITGANLQQAREAVIANIGVLANTPQYIEEVAKSLGGVDTALLLQTAALNNIVATFISANNERLTKAAQDVLGAGNEISNVNIATAKQKQDVVNAIMVKLSTMSVEDIKAFANTIGLRNDVDLSHNAAASLTMGTGVLINAVQATQTNLPENIAVVLEKLGIETRTGEAAQDAIILHIGNLAERAARGEIAQEDVNKVAELLGMNSNILMSVSQINGIIRNMLNTNSASLAAVMQALNLPYSEDRASVEDNIDSVILALAGKEITAETLQKVNTKLAGYARENMDRIRAELEGTPEKTGLIETAEDLKTRLLAAQGDLNIIDEDSGHLLGDAAIFADNEGELLKRFPALGSMIAEYTDAVNKAQAAAMEYAAAKAVYDMFGVTEEEISEEDLAAKPWLNKSLSMRERIRAFVATKFRVDAIDAENDGNSALADTFNRAADHIEQGDNPADLDVLSYSLYEKYESAFFKETYHPAVIAGTVDEAGNPVVETTDEDGTVTRKTVEGDTVITTMTNPATGVTVTTTKVSEQPLTVTITNAAGGTILTTQNTVRATTDAAGVTWVEELDAESTVVNTTRIAADGTVILGEPTLEELDAYSSALTARSDIKPEQKRDAQIVYMKKFVKEKSGYELRMMQAKLVLAVLAGKIGELATSAGKTFTAVSELIVLKRLNPNANIMILVPDAGLEAQWTSDKVMGKDALLSYKGLLAAAGYKLVARSSLKTDEEVIAAINDPNTILVSTFTQSMHDQDNAKVKEALKSITNIRVDEAHKWALSTQSGIM
ncbi:MAG: hypothetical protein Q8R48_04320, partial [Candidatus Omnitrophota bacterium]|nr:hypothetical protein [Candidatus Omnitrophota bacterium]